MSYLAWLVAISLAFAALERLRPARRSQRARRPELANDLVYNAVNGHLFHLALGWALVGTAGVARRGLDALGALPDEGGWLAERGFALQLVVFLVVSDLLQWLVHNLLHRVPLLWQFHKVHHAAPALDWAANLRFHWVELVVYKSLLYVPLLFLGGDAEPLFAAIVFATVWGHFNHSNLDVGLGPLAYVFNSPRMHLWHHDASDEGGPVKNLGIVLSLWDWLFGTAYWPRGRAPGRIGYRGDEEMPRDVLRQLAFPLTRRRP